MKTWLVSLGIIGILAVIAGAAYFGYNSVAAPEDTSAPEPVTVGVTRGTVEQTVTAPGQLVGVQETALSFAVEGQLAQILVRPGTVVKTGTPLARLNETPLQRALESAQLNLALAEEENARQIAQTELDIAIAEARLAQALAQLPNADAGTAQLAAAQAQLNDLLNGPDENELTIATVNLRQAEIALHQAQEAYDAVAWGADVAASPQGMELQAATLAYETAQATYNLATRNASPAQIASAQAQIAQAQTALAQNDVQQTVAAEEINILESQLQQSQHHLETLLQGIDPHLQQAIETAQTNLTAATLVAPFDGTVLDVNALPGQTLGSGQSFITLANPLAVEVWTTVIEEDLPLVQPGQPAQLYFDAAPETAIAGTVSRIVPQRIPGKDRPLYPVYISLNQTPPASIVSGMTADASIIIAQANNVLRLPRAVVRARADGTATIKVWQNGVIQEQEVQVGLKGDVYVEIIEGLTEKERVSGE